ncbi:hypothetical protein ACN265_19135 [Micromonospora sp. WMMD730]|uniref:hypothetical protein n=1 Tax=Micromonospora sp. WMMD730 TaxID=3404128 RepID=UPI003B95A033
MPAARRPPATRRSPTTSKPTCAYSPRSPPPNLPATFRIHDTTLSTDPVTAAQQLRDIALPYDRHGPIEATHEAARQAYREAFAEPITAQEQQYVDLLAALTPARRDKVIAAAEERASHPRP